MTAHIRYHDLAVYANEMGEKAAGSGQKRHVSAESSGVRGNKCRTMLDWNNLLKLRDAAGRLIGGVLQYLENDTVVCAVRTVLRIR